VRLAAALERSERVMPIAFVDRNPTLWRQYIGGYRVHRPELLRDLVQRHQVSEVVVALDTTSKKERASVLAELEKTGVKVRTLPDLTDIASGRVTINDLRPVNVLDLLGRDVVPPNPHLLARCVRGKSVLVTGAGGSIGSELCRQIIAQQPSRLIMLDVSENALYEIETEIQLAYTRRLAAKRLEASATSETATEEPAAPTEIVAVLGSVLDGAFIADVLETHHVRTVFHAAAYKHVPIIERNVALGVMNNTFGTWTVAKAAIASGVERMVLISTDKAVRPSSAMGASKRLAEMILQSLAAKRTSGTIFTMVRFGNVLDSSGSVMRRFRQQIADGGPVTVTHKDMIRYFMSIPEAAGLVIQAGAMASGGEVFLLDMGNPMRIEDLARSMIRLSGLDVKDDSHPGGDIAIEYIGLRPGEKLKEELLIGHDSGQTEHPRIFMSREPTISPEALEASLKDLGVAISQGQTEIVHDILRRTVEGYQSGEHTEDGLAAGDSLGYPWTPSGTRTLH
jgi:FlaA1/EpsC-like NDP-sugar epimerase